MSRNKIVIILFGPPGSGKGTQAELLSDKMGLLHLDTGRMAEDFLYHSSDTSEETQELKKMFEAGKLLPMEWVFKIMSRKVGEIHSAGFGVVLSGSPRTLPESQKFLPVLAELYGKENIYAFVLNVPPEVSVERNSMRLICSFCKRPILMKYIAEPPKFCPVCGGEPYKRTVDDPEIMNVRLKEYKDRTEPIFELMKNEGYKLQEIDGTPPPYKIAEQINAYLKNA